MASHHQHKPSSALLPSTNPPFSPNFTKSTCSESCYDSGSRNAGTQSVGSLILKDESSKLNSSKPLNLVTATAQANQGGIVVDKATSGSLSVPIPPLYTKPLSIEKPIRGGGSSSNSLPSSPTKFPRRTLEELRADILSVRCDSQSSDNSIASMQAVFTTEGNLTEVSKFTTQAIKVQSPQAKVDTILYPQLDIANGTSVMQYNIQAKLQDDELNKRMSTIKETTRHSLTHALKMAHGNVAFNEAQIQESLQQPQPFSKVHGKKLFSATWDKHLAMLGLDDTSFSRGSPMELDKYPPGNTNLPNDSNLLPPLSSAIHHYDIMGSEFPPLIQPNLLKS